MNNWSLSERLNFWGLITNTTTLAVTVCLGIAAIIVTLTVPELRCMVGLKSESCPGSTKTNTPYNINAETLNKSEMTKLPNYYFLLIRDSEKGKSLITIFRQGKQVYSQESTNYIRPYFAVESSEDSHKGENYSIVEGSIEGKDVTADGTLDIILAEECGCNAGFTAYSIVSMGEKVEKVFFEDSSIRTWQFKDFNNDGIYELETEDFSYNKYEDWVPRWDRFNPTVILRFKDGKFHLATDLMKTHVSVKSDFINEVKKAKAEFKEKGKLSNSAMEYMTQLAYSGNSNLAKEFLDLIWDSKINSEKDFFWDHEFIGDIATSDYWDDLVVMNNWNKEYYENLACPY